MYRRFIRRRNWFYLLLFILFNIYILMSKKAQFQHNLNKTRRQAKTARGNNQIKTASENMRDLFAGLGSIYLKK